jgi:hypothetical protein
MAAYYYQGQQIVTPFRLSSNEPVFSADSISLKVRRVKQGAQRWELEFSVILTDPADTFADMITNFHNTVTLEMPQLNMRGENISQGTCSNLVRVNNAHSANDSTVTIDGMGSNRTIKKGRFVKFSNHDKIYLVTATSTSSGAGSAILNIYPSLRTAVPNNTQLLYRDDTDAITLTAFRDISNTQGITYTDGILSEMGTINLIEAL